MRIQLTRASSFFPLLLFLFFLYACGGGKGKEKDMVNEPEQMNERVRTNITELLARIEADGKADDSSNLSRFAVVTGFYKQSNYNAVWSSSEQFLSIADSMLLFIRQAKLYGLFPNDYHDHALKNIAQRFAADTAAVADRRDAALWSKADVLLTDAFFNIAAHLHIGRLKVDSTYMNPDSVLTDQFFYTAIGQLQKGKPLSDILHALEPAHKGYVELKAAVKNFLDSANFESQYTYVSYPYKDSIAFVKSLVKRLKEEGMLSWQLEQVDAAQLKEAITKLQTRRELTVDGKFGVQVVAYLNNTDAEKFRRIAINLDRYKVLPPQMPERYIWVNLPAYKLELWDMDTIRLESKVVVGKPNTRTPLLTSKISDMVTYPQWTIPNSIIMKEIVPALRRDPGYLAKKGYSLLTWEGEEIDPYSVDWTKYKKGIPYKVVQGSGDANALGILKFNFPNKYSVYLHDTNQRYLFKNEKRALSHGCVRVQEWEKLTYYISALDSTNYESDPKRVVSDSIKVWLGRKEKHVVRVKTPLPVYFRYFTVAGKKGKLFFYDDIYHEDKTAREASFSTK
jgi:murein L,D-transpeptidase YcbB/YkuD